MSFAPSISILITRLVYLTPNIHNALLYAGETKEPTYLVLAEAALGNQYKIPEKDYTIQSGYDSAVAPGPENFEIAST